MEGLEKGGVTLSSIVEMTAHELAGLLAKKELSSQELVEEQFKRIDAVEEKVKAYLTITRELALEQASAVDEKRKRGEQLSPLAGIPMALKDNICTKGIKTTCASRMLENFVSPYDATVVERLRQADAVLLGKCNMDEFAMGSSTENSHFFDTRNPYDLTAVPGGSSGGSAAAVAAGEAVFALGSDTGGSIRQPAAFCGVIGLKPTYGAVSRYGLAALASSMDQIGPLTRDMTDCALVMQAIYGHDPLDSTSASGAGSDFTQASGNDVKGLRIGLPARYLRGEIAPEVLAYFHKAVEKLEELGAVCEEVSLPHTEYALPTHQILMSAEASSNLARYDGVRFGLRVEGEDVYSMYEKTRGEGFGEE